MVFYMESNQVIKYPLLTEKAVNFIEKENKIVFIVDNRADKTEIKHQIEELYNVKVEGINTMIDFKGKKKAYVKIAPEFSAEDLASRLGVI